MALQRIRSDFSGITARGLVAVLCAALLVSGDAMLLAQQEGPPASPAQKPAPKLSGDQIDSLVAPIALYPDPLLSQTLVASTYPLEIVQAQQWLAKNSSLKGDALAQAAMKQEWDSSVQAMVQYPDLVKRMTENIKWTTDLGNAFLAQQEDVMDSVQRLRLKAKESGKLQSTEQQTVTTKVVEKETVVVIQPASTQVIYVPTYSPTVIWGAPVYYPYPPIYYPPYYAGAALFTFSVGVAIGASMHGGYGWGCGWGHGGNTVIINNNNNYIKNTNVKNNVNVNNKASNWQHNPQHRGAVPYANSATAKQYGGSARGDSMATRQAQARTAGASTYGSNRGASSSASGSNRSAGASGMSGGDRVGNRSIPSSSSYGSSFGGGGSSPSHASASSARGSSSMGTSRGSSGASRSAGGGGKRR